MEPRIKHPAQTLPGAMQALQSLDRATRQAGVPEVTLELLRLRAGQINGCSACVNAGMYSARKSGETDERLLLLTAWRETSVFTDAERAALALTEAATRLADRSDAVTDEIWREATRHYDESGLSAIILMIAVTNMFNRINATIKEPAGATWS